MTARLAAIVVFTCLTYGCGSLEPITDCEPRGDARPVCGFQNPEDLVVLPDGRSLLVSEFGSMEGDRPGRLVRYDTRTDARTVVYEGGTPGARLPGWGDERCPGPPSPAFSPHGIELAKRPSGELALLVVNHGGRESIEMFEVDSAGSVAWRGCAEPPAGTFMNDVAALPDGGFVASHMYHRETGSLGLAWALLRGRDTGHVVEWHAERGWGVVPGTAAAFPNGVAVSADGSAVYMNASLGGVVRRIDRASGRETARADVPGPDNASWSNGRLLVASLRAPTWRVLGCADLRAGACPLAFAIVALDPDTLAARELYAGEGPPMGAGTVAVEVDGELFIGTFAGDRLLRVRPAVMAGRR
jgi:hypothetical protein